MDKNDYQRSTSQSDTNRSNSAIRQDMADSGEKISQIVDELGQRIHEKLDWREYVKASPYLTLGVAASIGCLTWRRLRKRNSSTERLVRIVTDRVSESLGEHDAKAAGPGLIHATLLAVAVKAAIGLIPDKDSVAESSENEGYES